MEQSLYPVLLKTHKEHNCQQIRNGKIHWFQAEERVLESTARKLQQVHIKGACPPNGTGTHARPNARTLSHLYSGNYEK